MFRFAMRYRLSTQKGRFYCIARLPARLAPARIVCKRAQICNLRKSGLSSGEGVEGLAEVSTLSLGYLQVGSGGLSATVATVESVLQLM